MSSVPSKRKTKKQQLQEQQNQKVKNSLQVTEIIPQSDNQNKIFDAYDEKQNLLLHGLAGTGKTFCALYLALEEVLDSKDYYNITLIRSVVPSRDIGFLPGTADEKSEVYEAPYIPIVNKLFGNGAAYEILKKQNTIKFMTTSFLRGITLNNTIIIVDEIQNCSWSELSTIITRVGNNCRIIFCGDFRQSDLVNTKYYKTKDDVIKFMSVLKRMNEFTVIEMDRNDIVRSGIVKSFILAADEMGYL